MAEIIKQVPVCLTVFSLRCNHTKLPEKDPPKVYKYIKNDVYTNSRSSSNLKKFLKIISSNVFQGSYYLLNKILSAFPTLFERKTDCRGERFNVVCMRVSVSENLHAFNLSNKFYEKNHKFELNLNIEFREVVQFYKQILSDGEKCGITYAIPCSKTRDRFRLSSRFIISSRLKIDTYKYGSEVFPVLRCFPISALI